MGPHIPRYSRAVCVPCRSTRWWCAWMSGRVGECVALAHSLAPSLVFGCADALTSELVTATGPVLGATAVCVSTAFSTCSCACAHTIHAKHVCECASSCSWPACSCCLARPPRAPPCRQAAWSAARSVRHQPAERPRRHLRQQQARRCQAVAPWPPVACSRCWWPASHVWTWPWARARPPSLRRAAPAARAAVPPCSASRQSAVLRCRPACPWCVRSCLQSRDGGRGDSALLATLRPDARTTLQLESCNGLWPWPCAGSAPRARSASVGSPNRRVQGAPRRLQQSGAEPGAESGARDAPSAMRSWRCGCGWASRRSQAKGAAAAPLPPAG